MLTPTAYYADPDHSPTRVIAFGGGIQSTVMFFMTIEGLFGDFPDYGVFADTGWEPPYVYEHVKWMQSQITIPLYIVGRTPGLDHALTTLVNHSGNEGYVDIPVYLKGRDGEKDGIGMRQCTSHYKIRPTEAKIRELWGVGPRKWVKPWMKAEVWMGITTDEIERMKPASTKWVGKRYPLIDACMSRQDCIDWWKNEFPERNLLKSSCVGCPYQSNARWLLMRDQYPKEFQQAVEIDASLRTDQVVNIKEPYLHRSRTPLGEAVEQLACQMKVEGKELNDFINECDGYCDV